LCRTATKSADTFRRQIVKSKNLNIVFLEGSHLNQIVKDPSAIVHILNEQAREALSISLTRRRSPSAAPHSRQHRRRTGTGFSLVGTALQPTVARFLAAAGSLQGSRLGADSFTEEVLPG
jgi:hypothetical protein